MFQGGKEPELGQLLLRNAALLQDVPLCLAGALLGCGFALLAGELCGVCWPRCALTLCCLMQKPKYDYFYTVYVYNADILQCRNEDTHT